MLQRFIFLYDILIQSIWFNLIWFIFLWHVITPYLKVNLLRQQNFISQLLLALEMQAKLVMRCSPQFLKYNITTCMVVWCVWLHVNCIFPRNHHRQSATAKFTTRSWDIYQNIILCYLSNKLCLYYCYLRQSFTTTI